jgi:hypothetical protein
MQPGGDEDSTDTFLNESSDIRGSTDATPGDNLKLRPLPVEFMANAASGTSSLHAHIGDIEHHDGAYSPAMDFPDDVDPFHVGKESWSGTHLALKEIEAEHQTLTCWIMLKFQPWFT